MSNTSEVATVKAITITERNGELLADSRDVAEVLGVEHASIVRLIRDNSDDFGRVGFEIAPLQTAGGTQSTTFALIPETETLLLITYVRNTEQSKVAKRALIEAFQAMRAKLSARPLAGMDLIAAAVIEAQKVIARQAELIEAQKPAVQFMADVTGSKDAIEMGQAAKIIGMGMGRNRLFEFLRTNGVLRDNNEPYQKYVDAGWFRIVEQSWKDSKGETHINIKTMVYQKGIDGIIKLIRTAS